MRPRSSRFSPRLVAPEVLEQLTVARGPMLTRVVGNLTAAIAAGHGRFELLVAPQGVGKSHMLGLVEARVRANVELQGRLVVVSLPNQDQGRQCWRRALDDGSSAADGSSLPHALDSSVRVPLRIASGRELARLRDELARGTETRLPAAFEYALAAEDNSRAFARLGAESRAFARDYLRVIAADDLLDSLPAEPTLDGD